MKSIRKISAFYLKPFIVILLLYLVYFFIVGSYLEEWEGFFSTAVEGIYTHPAIWGWDTDTHFLLLYIYRWLAELSTDYNVYGFILVFNNWVGLTFLGCVVYRILRINISNYSLLLFGLLFSILCVDNIINLNSTRHAFILIAATLGYIESRRFEMRAISKSEWVGLSCIIVYAALIRFDAALLFSIVYLVLLIIHKKLSRAALVPILLSASIYCTYHVTSAMFSSDAKKVLIYKEREIFDRYNVDYDKLSPLQKLDVDAIMQYCITDKEHFTLQFYDSISKHHPPKGILNVLNGFNYDSFFVSWMLSRSSFISARYFIIFYLLSGLFVLFRKTSARFYIHYFFLALSPVLLCFYTVVPLRFLIPFFAISGCLNVLIYLRYNGSVKIISAFCLVIFLFMLSEIFKSKKMYDEKAANYTTFSNRLLSLGENQSALHPIVINSVFPVNYFPLKPFDKLYKQHAVFLNFYLFSADNYQIQTWKELCHCNTFSLKERVDYIVANKNLFLIDDKAYEFMKRYFSEKYHIAIQKTVLSNFDNNLRVCNLSYVTENK